MSLVVSDDYRKFAVHCVRRPIADVEMDFHDTLESVTCDVTLVEYAKFADSPVSSVVSSYADITLSNADGKYLQFLDNTLANCDDEVQETITSKDVRPGMEMVLRTGFKIPTTSTDQCEYNRDTTQQFIGTNSKFPAYTTEQTGRSLAQFHFVDKVDQLASSSASVDKDYSGFTVAEILNDWFNTVFTGNTITIPADGAVTAPDPFIIPAGDIFGDYLKDLVDLNGGRFAQLEDGTFIYQTHAVVNDGNLTPDFMFNTCDHVIDVDTPSLDEIYNAVRVQQFTNPGGVEYTAIDQASIDKYGRREFVVTNELVDSEDKARIIAERVVEFYNIGTFERQITVVGLGFLEIYDKVSLKERVKSSACSNCGCETLYVNNTYRIKKIYGSIGPDGFIEKMTLTRSPLSENPFVFCESEVCSSDNFVDC